MQSLTSLCSKILKVRNLTFMMMFVLGLTTFAWAIAVPAAGSFAYDAYNIGVNEILNGPIGFVLGVLAIGFGAWAAIRSEIMLALGAVLGGGVLLQADTVVASLGAII